LQEPTSKLLHHTEHSTLVEFEKEEKKMWWFLHSFPMANRDLTIGLGTWVTLFSGTIFENEIPPHRSWEQHSPHSTISDIYIPLLLSGFYKLSQYDYSRVRKHIDFPICHQSHNFIVTYNSMYIELELSNSTLHNKFLYWWSEIIYKSHFPTQGLPTRIQSFRIICYELELTGKNCIC